VLAVAELANELTMKKKKQKKQKKQQQQQQHDHDHDSELATSSSSIMPRTTVTTFGCPRLGNKEFSNGFDQVCGVRHWRVQNGWDPITRVPFHGPKPIDFRHTGLHVWLRHGYADSPPSMATAAGNRSSGGYGSPQEKTKQDQHKLSDDEDNTSSTTSRNHESSPAIDNPPVLKALTATLPVLAKLPKLSQLPKTVAALPKLLAASSLVPPPLAVHVEGQLSAVGGVPEAAPVVGVSSGRVSTVVVKEVLEGSHGLGHHQMGGARGYLASLERAVWRQDPCSERHGKDRHSSQEANDVLGRLVKKLTQTRDPHRQQAQK
jgi:hypothetical protein